MLYCNPPGRTDPDSLSTFDLDSKQYNYIYFHDQEPVYLDLHAPLFQAVEDRNQDLCFRRGPHHSAIVTSEYQSEAVEQAQQQYGWRHYYYFFHGWASLDWYRGYNYTQLMPNPQDRVINRTFIAPNRIIAGARQHRLLMLYHIFKNNMQNNWVSCPAVCPGENISAVDASSKLAHIYPDIQDVFEKAPLPMSFPNESDAPMHSCWLSLFDESADSLLYLVTETIASGRRNHLTEKSFKPICLRMPFVLVATAGSLAYLRKYGFQTFSDFWDESYDHEPDEVRRIEMIADVLKRLNAMTPTQKQSLFNSMIPVLEHNYNHFYNGGFESELKMELDQMMISIQQDFV
jgi:hypothetical protein